MNEDQGADQRSLARAGEQRLATRSASLVRRGLELAGALARRGLPKLYEASVRLRYIVAGHRDFITTARFSTDCRLIASASVDGTVYIWRVDDGSVLRVFDAHARAVTSLSFSPDAALLASGSADCTACLWDVRRGVLHRRLSGHTAGITSVAFSSDGELLASGSLDTTVRVWRVSDGAAVRTLRRHSAAVTDVAYFPYNMITSVSEDGVSCWWSAASGTLLRTWSESWYPPDPTPVRWEGHHDRDIRFEYWPSDQQLRISRWSDGTLMRYLGGGVTREIVFSPKGQLFTSRPDPLLVAVRLWRVSDGVLIRTLGEYQLSISGVAFSPDGELVAARCEDNLYVWHVADGCLLDRLSDVYDKSCAGGQNVAFSPDGRLLAFASGWDGVCLWDMSNRSQVTDLPAQGTSAGEVSFSPDGNFLASASSGDSTDGRICVWRVGDGKLIHRIRVEHACRRQPFFSPDSQIMAVLSWDGTLSLWRVSDGPPRARLWRAHGAVESAAFSPDGRFLALGSRNNTVSLLHSSDGSEVHILRGHTGAINSIVFSPNGLFLASGSRDHTVRLWRVSDGALLQELTGHVAPVTQVTFNPDGRVLASVGEDVTIRMWELH